MERERAAGKGVSLLGSLPPSLLVGMASSWKMVPQAFLEAAMLLKCLIVGKVIFHKSKSCLSDFA